jgi:hypothetical protein
LPKPNLRDIKALVEVQFLDATAGENDFND